MAIALRRYIPGLGRRAMVQGDEIDADTIAAGDIAANAVGASELADNAVDTAAIAAGALSADAAGRAKMADGLFDTATLLAKIAAGAMTEANVDAIFAAGAIDGSDRLKAASVTASRLAADVIAIVAEVTLTNAQVLALRAAPITIIAAPPAGQAIVVHRVAVKSDSAAGAWTEPDVNNLALEYTSGLDIVLIEATGFVTTGSIQYRTYAPVATEFSPVPAEAVRLFQVGAAEFGGGNAANTLRVEVAYFILG